MRSFHIKQVYLLRLMLRENKSFYSTQKYLSYDKYNHNGKGDSEIDPIVIVHGLFGQKRNWRAIAKNLARNLRTDVYAIDLVNHGESYWKDRMDHTDMSNDLKDFVDRIIANETQLFREKINLLGHSLGGKVAMKFSTNYSDLLNSLVIVDVAPKTYNNIKHFTLLIDAMQKINLNQTINEIRSNLQEQNVADFDTCEFLLTNLARQADRTYKWKLNLNVIGKEISKLTVSNIPKSAFLGDVLFISGSKSNYITESDYTDIRQKFPKAKFSAVENANHWVHYTQPHVFLNIVTGFIKSLYGCKNA